MALTDPVPSQAIDVFKRNMEDVDSVVNNTSGTVTNRTGKTMRPLPVVSDSIEQQITSLTADINAAKADLYPIVKFRFLVDTYEITNRNELGDTATGEAYRYIGTTLPFSVTPATNPVGNPDFVQVIQTDHNNLTNRNAIGAHDDIYIRSATLSEAQTENAPIGTRYTIFDLNNSRYNVVDIGDTGGVYKPISATKKLKLVYSGLFIDNKAVDNAEYNLSIFGGALRRTPLAGSNKWEHITDSAHEPYGVSATVDDLDDYQFRVNYSNAAGENVKVGTTLFSLDYELAPYGIMTGANGGINSSTYQMFAPCVLYIDGAASVTASPLWTSNGLGITATPAQYIISHPPRALTIDPPMLSTIVTQAGSMHSTLYELSWGATQTTITAKDTLAGYISCDGVTASVSLSRNINLTATVVDGVITITHDNVIGRYVAQVSPFDSDAYTPHIVSIGDTTIQVGFKDETGAVVTTPSNKMKFMFSRNALVSSLIDSGVRFGLDLGLCRVKNQDVGNISLNNFWYIGFNNV